MFLHAGNNKNIRIKNIIGIFDMDNATVSPITRKYLSNAQKQNCVFSVAEEIPKSFIIFKDGENISVCFSPLSASSLAGRIDRK